MNNWESIETALSLSNINVGHVTILYMCVCVINDNKLKEEFILFCLFNTLINTQCFQIIYWR